MNNVSGAASGDKWDRWECQGPLSLLFTPLVLFAYLRGENSFILSHQVGSPWDRLSGVRGRGQTWASSSSVKSFLMLKVFLISSGVFPLIMLATVLQVTSNRPLMSR